MNHSPVWTYINARLASLDHITRREVLLRLLRDGAFLALLAGEAADAADRKMISAKALTAPAPDPRFQEFRTRLTEGARVAVDQLVRQTVASVRAGRAAGVVIVVSGQTVAACGGSFTCGSNTCSKEACDGTNSCDRQTCDTLKCSGTNSCGGSQTCNRLTSALTTGGILSRYGNHPFVVELKEMFGADVERQVDQMIRAGTTLRQRGLVDPRAPKPPVPAPVQQLLRQVQTAPPATGPSKPVPPKGAPPKVPERPPATGPSKPTLPKGAPTEPLSPPKPRTE